jgi:preprotein translocase subunit SecE
MVFFFFRFSLNIGKKMGNKEYATSALTQTATSLLSFFHRVSTEIRVITWCTTKITLEMKQKDNNTKAILQLFSLQREEIEDTNVI